MRNKHQGMTLLELLIVLAIVGISVTLAPPTLSKWVYRQESRSNALHILQLIQYARVQAIDRHLPVIICGSNTVSTCTHNWNHGILVFLDKDKNNQVDSEIDTILRLQPPVSNDGYLIWRAAFGKKYFRALPSGRISYTGSFTYCPANHDPHFASQVIVSNTGRPRFAQDKDSDGIIENARGKPVSCDG